MRYEDNGPNAQTNPNATSNGGKIELLRDYYNSANPMRFYEFNGDGPNTHGHFGKIYKNAGVEGGSWGGDQSGAIYVWPMRMSHNKVVCCLIGRGVFAHYDNVLQVLPLEACVFYDVNGDPITWEETFDQYISAAKFKAINQFNYSTYAKVLSWKDAYSAFRYNRSKRWLINRTTCKGYGKEFKSRGSRG